MDPITVSILGHACVNITEEMGVNLFKSAHSTIVREVRDLSTALFDADGNCVAMGNWIPMLLNAMAPGMDACKKEYDLKETKPNEAYVLNNPFKGGQHVNDILLFTPIIFKGELIAFSCSNVHHLDLGGGGGGEARATEVYEEGIVFSPMKITLDNDWESSVFGKIFEANIRVPEKTIPDFNAQIIACRTGETRVIELVKKYGVDTIKNFFEYHQNYSERIVREAIKGIPDGEYSGESYMEDDGVGNGPFWVRLKIVVKGSEIIIDLSDSDKQAPGFINIPYASTYATVRTSIMSIIQAGHRLVNSGAFRPIKIITTPGTIVHAVRPAATRARTSACYKIFDSINQALKDVMPDRVMAPGFDAQTGIALSRRFENGRYSKFSEVMGGGNGAMKDLDGHDAMIMPLTNGQNTPIESIELEFPFLEVLGYGMVVDSSGAGEFRGGNGIERKYRILDEGVVLATHSDRHEHSVPGFFGGRRGATGAFILQRDGEYTRLSSKVSIKLKKGDILCLRSGGGAGYGDPKNRNPEKVYKDVREGRLSPEKASEDYGIAIEELRLSSNQF